MARKLDINTYTFQSGEKVTDITSERFDDFMRSFEADLRVEKGYATEREYEILHGRFTLLKQIIETTMKPIQEGTKTFLTTEENRDIQEQMMLFNDYSRFVAANHWNQGQNRFDVATENYPDGYDNWHVSVEENLEEGIEQIQSNGGMSEAAMEADIAAEENPRPDYIDEQRNPHWFDEEDYANEQIPLEIVDRTEMLYFNSNNVSAREYKIRIDEGLFKLLAPEQYSETIFYDGEIPAITYRQSTNPEVPDQFLISKFKQGDYDNSIIQATIELKDEEILQQIKSTVGNYEYNEYINSPDFIEKFGDWEKANRLEKIASSEALNISDRIIIHGRDETNRINALRSNKTDENLDELDSLVTELGKEMLGNLRLEQNLNQFANPILHISDDGKAYKFNFAGIKESKHHNLFQKGHIEGIYNIPEIVKSAIYVGTEKNEDGRKPELERFHYYVLGIKLNNDDYTAKVVFTEKKDGEVYYDQSLSTIEKGRFIDLIKETPEAFNRINRPDSFKGSTGAVNQHEQGLNSIVEYYDKRLFNICQVPQMPYLEKNPVTGKWQPTEDAVQLVKSGQLHVEKSGQKYYMIDSRTELNQKTEYSSSSTAFEYSKSSLEAETLLKAGELLKNMQFTPENYKKLLNVINEISEMNGLKNLAIPKEEEIVSNKDNNATFKDVIDSVSETKVGETLKSIAEHGAGLPEGSIQTAQAIQDKLYEVVNGDTKTEHPGKNETNENREEQPQRQPFNGKSEIVFGETTLPTFSVLVDGKIRSIENAVINGHNKETGSYFVEANGEKIELPKETFNTLYKDKIEHEQQKARLAEGKTIVLEDKEQGIKGTEIPEWAMYTTKGLESFKGFVAQKFNQTDNTYILSNGDSTITVSATRFKEITAPERFEKKFDENTPAWKKLCEQQYKDFFLERSNTAYNFKHNFGVYCRKEANSPCDALHLAKEIISKMSKAEQKKVQSLIKEISHANETPNEVIARMYHDSIKEIPLQEEYIKKYQPKNVIARPFYDTLSTDGQKVENDPALIQGTFDFNLKIGSTIKNVDIQTEKLFGKGKDSMHFSELKVISASKEGNSITLMDNNKSFIKVPRDTFLNTYKEKQIKEMKKEIKYSHSNSMYISY